MPGIIINVGLLQFVLIVYTQILFVGLRHNYQINMDELLRLFNLTLFHTSCPIIFLKAGKYLYLLKLSETFSADL